MRRIALLVSVVVLGAVGHPNTVEAAWQITQLTDTDGDNYMSFISGTNVAWVNGDGAFLYDGTTTIQFPVGGWEPDTHLGVSDRNIAWKGWDGIEDSSGEIFLYDIDQETTTRLTNNSYEDHFPRVFGDDVLWQGRSGTSGTTSKQLFLYDGTTTTQLTNGVKNVGGYWKSGDDIVFQRRDATEQNDYEIYLYDVDQETTTQLTNNNYIDWFARQNSVFDGNVVWWGYDGNDYEIFLYDIDQETTTQLTNNNYNDVNPQISDEYIMWAAGFPDQGPIFLYDGTTTTQIADNGLEDDFVLSGGNAAWIGRTESGYDEIFFFDGNTTSQVTNDLVRKLFLGLSGENLTWMGGAEIYFATLVPDPTADFDDNGTCDGVDFQIWETYFGLIDPIGRPVHEIGDADLDSDIDGSDFLNWQAEFGMSFSNVGTAATVPEPSAWLLALVGLAFGCFPRERL